MRRFWHIEGLSAGFEVARNKNSSSLQLAFGGENTITFHIAIPMLFSLWLILDSWKIGKVLNVPYEAHRTGFDLSWPMFVAEIWQNEHEYKRGDLRVTVMLDYLLFGRPTYTSTQLSEHLVNVQMPEAAYPFKITLTQDTWDFPRFKPPHILRRAHCETDGDGIPHPGKGTTSYNLDDDALMGLTCEAETVWDAVEKIKEQVNYCRENYPL